MLVTRQRIGLTEVLTLNRPEAANSLNPALIGELGAALEAILGDDDARAVVITGAGERHFCAGMDLSALADVNARSDGPQPGSAMFAQLMAGDYPKPLIAAVNGAAVGGGMELVMACDMAIAADHARFGLPEVKRGLYAAGGGTMLSTRMPLALALEMGLTGRLIDAPKAAAAGLVNQIVALADLMATVTALADEIAGNGPLGVQLTKKLMRYAVSKGPDAGQATPEEMNAVFRSDDAREGATAFMEKRPARFTGR